MIRKEVEKLRGFVFTDDELKEVILPAIPATPVKLTTEAIESVERDNNIPPEKSILAKEEKRLWKIKLEFYNTKKHKSIIYVLDTRELYTDQAEKWHSDVAKSIKEDKPAMYVPILHCLPRDVRNVYVVSYKLFYKKDNEWVLFED